MEKNGRFFEGKTILSGSRKALTLYGDQAVGQLEKILVRRDSAIVEYLTRSQGMPHCHRAGDICDRGVLSQNKKRSPRCLLGKTAAGGSINILQIIRIEVLIIFLP